MRFRSDREPPETLARLRRSILDLERSWEAVTDAIKRVDAQDRAISALKAAVRDLESAVSQLGKSTSAELERINGLAMRALQSEGMRARKGANREDAELGRQVREALERPDTARQMLSEFQARIQQQWGGGDGGGDDDSPIG